MAPHQSYHEVGLLTKATPIDPFMITLGQNLAPGTAVIGHINR